MENNKLVATESKIFEYSGKDSLKIKGPISGKTYYFRHTGFKLEVASEDVPSFMGEDNLKLIKGPQAKSK